MPNIYKSLVTRVPVDSIKPSDVANCPGTIILRRAQPPKNFDTMFNSFCAYFLVANHWIWNGGAVTPNSGDILDGTKNTGQCAALANALRQMAILKPPFGLGINENLVGEAAGLAKGQYDGANGFGFIAQHGANVKGLPANVFAAPANTQFLDKISAASPRTTLYLWANHKTIPYAGKYYDPSYGVIWLSKASMATYEIDAENIERLENVQNSSHVIRTNYSRATGAGGQFYFRTLLPDEVNATQTNGYQGPFTNLPGQDVADIAPTSVSDLRRKFNK